VKKLLITATLVALTTTYVSADYNAKTCKSLDAVIKIYANKSGDLNLPRSIRRDSFGKALAFGKEFRDHCKNSSDTTAIKLSR